MDISFLAIISGLIGIVVTILWLVIGWRAMRAHEQLAESHSGIESEIRKIAKAVSTDSKKLNLADIDPKSLPKFTE